MSGKWYENGLCFFCKKCGNCCTGAPGYVWLKGDEALKIAGYIGMDVEEFMLTKARLVRSRYSLKELKSGDCIFFQRESVRCDIYEVRPVQCRTFPFWEELLLKQSFWEKTGEDCPGINQRDFHSFEEIERVLLSNEES